jgi:alkanesulfonate monooxygenase SsuD/methylene tetrahydromethanopterin reductase-like flavin-dependent oxidoreductase (luciferase family)
MEHANTVKVGVLLPHFGADSSTQLVSEAARKAEAWGFDSVWVRDHLSFQPHGFEEQSTRFMEPFTTLAALAAQTERITLGTAVTIPFRHPLVVSQLLGGIRDVAGPGRLIAGIGAGQPRLPFAATETDFTRRFGRAREFAEILRATFTGELVDYAGELYAFEGVIIDPAAGSETPIWYGGSSIGSVRRASSYADGWMPARCPLPVLESRIRQLREEDAARNKKTTIAYMPLLSLTGNGAESLVEDPRISLLREARSNAAWEGTYDSPGDIDGMLVTGTPEECLAELLGFVDRGVEHLVVDLRLRHGDFLRQLALLAEHVLPSLKDARAGAA